MQRTTGFLIRFGLLLCLAPQVWSDTPPSASQTVATENSAANSTERWLEEVRAQRKAQEQWHQQAKQASDERLRRIDPWGAARLKSLEQQADKRFEAMEHRSQAIRQQAESEQQARRQAYDSWLDRQEPFRGHYLPFGWDNRWYYRGY